MLLWLIHKLKTAEPIQHQVGLDFADLTFYFYYVKKVVYSVKNAIPNQNKSIISI